MSRLCCAAYADGAELGSACGVLPLLMPHQQLVCHFCSLLRSLCRQQRLGSPEGRTALGGGAPCGEGPRPPGRAVPSWVSTRGGLGEAEGAFPDLTLWRDLTVIALSTASLRSPPAEAPVYQDLPVRAFVALFDYDPVSMSPNPDAGEEELPFREGQILKVTD